MVSAPIIIHISLADERVCQLVERCDGHQFKSTRCSPRMARFGALAFRTEPRRWVNSWSRVSTERRLSERLPDDEGKMRFDLVDPSSAVQAANPFSWRSRHRCRQQTHGRHLLALRVPHEMHSQLTIAGPQVPAHSECCVRSNFVKRIGQPDRERKVNSAEGRSQCR